MLDSDTRLVRCALAGDRQAFEALHRRHLERVWNLLRRLTQDEQAAADLTQDAFIAAYRSLASWRGNGAFTTWLSGIAVMLYRNRCRGQREPDARLDAADDLRDERDDPLERCAAADARRRIEAAIADLPAACREAFVLVRVEGMSYGQAAALLDIPLGTVNSRLGRATTLLRRALSDMASEREVSPDEVTTAGMEKVSHEV